MTSTFTSNLTNNINNTLTSEFNNFVFDFSSETYNPLDPYIHNLISFLISHNITKTTLEELFQTSMTTLSFRFRLDLNTIKKITYYTYYLITKYPHLLTKYK